jgi:hypothetical protein
MLVFKQLRNHILTPEDLYKQARENITGVIFFYITQKEIKANVLCLTGHNVLRLSIVHRATLS